MVGLAPALKVYKKETRKTEFGCRGDRLRAAQVEITGWEIQDIRDVNERLWSQFGSKVYHPNQTFHLNQAFILLNPNLAH